MSVFQQYDLKIKRNPFKLHKQHQFIQNGKKLKDKTVSKKQKVLIASSQKLKNFYHINTSRQPNLISLKQNQTSQKSIFRNSNCETENSENCKRAITGYCTTVNKKISLQNLKISSKLKNQQKIITQKTKVNQKSSIQQFKLTQKPFENQKQQNQILLNQKSQKIKSKSIKQIISPRNPKRNSVDHVFKPLQKKQIKMNVSLNKLLGKFVSLKQFGMSITQDQSQRMLNFTFGKSA